jgi:serine/threonine-protein kinase
MGTTDPPAYQLDPAHARRLVGSLCLRPGERVLHLGPADAPAARLASYLVGPAGEVVDADPGRLPFPDDEFDAVFSSQLAAGVPTGVLAELGRVTRPTGRVAFALARSDGRDPEWVAALVERSGLRGAGVRFDPGTEPDAVPACLVTAFPPRPASPPGGATPRELAEGTAGGVRSTRRAGPALTLLAGVGLAAGLLIASAVAAGGGGPAAEPAPVGEAGSAAPAPTVASSPEPAAVPVAPEPVTYVGRVDGGGASVAIIVDGADTVAYVCDGATAEAWLYGAAGAGEVDLTGDGGSLVARYDDRWAAGQVTLAGQRWTFTAEQVAPPEGLYQFAETIAGGAEVTGGWIVLPDGSQIGLLAVDGDRQPAPAVDLDTGQVRIDGRLVRPQRQG